jgi:hypothetical protein
MLWSSRPSSFHLGHEKRRPGLWGEKSAAATTKGPSEIRTEILVVRVTCQSTSTTLASDGTVLHLRLLALKAAVSNYNTPVA